MDSITIISFGIKTVTVELPAIVFLIFFVALTIVHLTI